MEVLILIIGLMAFFESDLKDVDVAKNIKTVGYNQTILVKEVINQNDKFEITNKNQYSLHSHPSLKAKTLI
jgi:hypothetical protein